MRKRTSSQTDGYRTQKLCDAANDETFIRHLINCYIATFNATGEGEWHESWSVDEVRQKLFIDTQDESDRTFLTTWEVRGSVAGFVIIIVDSFDRIPSIRELPPRLQTPAHLEAVRRHMAWVAGSDEMMCVFQEYGIRPDFRTGLEPVLRLLAEAGAAALEAGATYAWFWTSRQSRLYQIIVGLDCRMIYDFDDPGSNVMLGDDLSDLRRRVESPRQLVRAMLTERQFHVGYKR